jgi:hypothetical protein
MDTKAENFLEPGASLFFEGRAWWDKSGGNVYHSVRVWVNGQIVAIVPMRYGYENAYHVSAVERLVQLGYLPEWLSDTTGPGRPTREYPTWRIEKILDITIYSSLTFGKKSELFKAAE